MNKKTSKKPVGKKSKTSSRKLNVYSNLSKRGRKNSKKISKATSRARSSATGFWGKLQSLPVLRYWLSRRGAIMALKVLGISLLLICLVVGALFAYFRKDLDAISPGEINKRVQSTVTVYLDRNDKVLWEDKGGSNYKLVVESDELSDHLKNATIALEDKDFYDHGGVSPTGLVRAAVNNFRGGNVQGGSTLTQQLVKQVFFADEAGDRGLTGIPRKIKEVILAIEVERMYDKEQILTLYLNESPYGGPRNGAESGSQAYFGKPAKELTIAEAALLAAIPQSPSVYDPYNVAGHAGLISRQHTTIDKMAEQDYITEEEAEEAKDHPILDHIVPQSSRYEGIRAPHFVQMVQSDLQEEIGAATLGRGGLTIKTTLDVRAQDKLEEAMDDMFDSFWPDYAGFSNGASTVQDVETGQIIALMGSRDFEWPGFGQDNAAVAHVQPGSTIKPLVYSELFEKKPSGQQNFGSGTILKDERIDNIYGAPLQNADRAFKGNIPIRTSLATSRNIPAVKAMHVSGVQPTLETIREMGADSYCTQGSETQVGLAAAIGGCGVRQVDLVNAFTTLARQGVYKPQSTILEVRNNSNEVLYKWSDPAGERVISNQSAYIVSDILNDDVARSPLAGRFAEGMYINGVPTATKTGTSDRGGEPRDIWMMSYSPALSMGVWLGNSDGSVLRQGNSLIPGAIIAKTTEYIHKEIYAKEDKWQPGQWFTQPNGIKTDGGEIYPEWWNKSQSESEEKLTFDRLSRKVATKCTPDRARIEIDVIKMIDPVTDREIYIAPDGYDGTEEDDRHSCNDNDPAGSFEVNYDEEEETSTITLKVTKGTFPIDRVQIRVDGTAVANMSSQGPYKYTYTWSESDEDTKSISATIVDDGYYDAVITGSITRP